MAPEVGEGRPLQSGAVGIAAETEYEVGTAVRLMAQKGIAALRVSRLRDPEIMAAVAVPAVYEPHLAAAIAGMSLAEPAIAALKKLARHGILDDREWAHLHDVLDAFATP